MRSDLRPMNFAERLVAGPPVLATVGRRAQVGDLVVLAPDVEPAERAEVFEVLDTVGAMVGTPGVLARSLVEPEYTGKYHYREVVVLTKVEAKAARAYYADLEANP